MRYSEITENSNLNIFKHNNLVSDVMWFYKRKKATQKFIIICKYAIYSQNK